MRMSRDPLFNLADSLVPDVYNVSRVFPTSERFGLQLQLRKASVSAASNIVEGCARRTTKEYVNFLNIACGSAAEAAYISSLSVRLEFFNAADGNRLAASYGGLVAMLTALIHSLEGEP